MDLDSHRDISDAAKKEINLLRHQLTESDLQQGEVQFLLSLLNQREPGQKEIAQKLKKQGGISYTGSLRTTRPTRTYRLAGSKSAR